MPGWVLGIDFGTTSTVAALRAPVASGGRLDLVSLGNRPPQLPSAVFCDDRGTMRVGPYIPGGAPAINIERTPKRWVGGGVLVGALMVDDRDLVATVLGFVGEEARRATNGEEPERVVLTHPATWQAGRLRRLTEATGRAYLPEPELVPEPVAAARALLERGAFDALPDDALVAVYDLGGGTLDLSLLRHRDGGFVLVGEPSGHDELGGEYLDQYLLDHVVNACGEGERALLIDPTAAAGDTPAWRRAAAELRTLVRDAKENLKYATTCEILLPEVIESRRSYTLTQDELREVATPMIRRTVELLETRLLGRNGHTAADLSAICLVGGGARLALVPALLGERFGCQIAAHGDLATLVATGAALTPAPASVVVPERATRAPAGTATVPVVPPTSPRPHRVVPGERSASNQVGLAKAADARRRRAETKERLKRGGIGIGEVLEQSRSDAAIGAMTVSALLQAMPGIGPVRAEEVARRLEITRGRRLRELPHQQRLALIEEFAAEPQRPTAAEAVPRPPGDVVIEHLRLLAQDLPSWGRIHIADSAITGIPRDLLLPSGIDPRGPIGVTLGLIDMTFWGTAKNVFGFTASYAFHVYRGHRWICPYRSLPSMYALRGKIQMGERFLTVTGPLTAIENGQALVGRLHRLRQALG